MVSLGQCNTTILCPAFTSHSELDADALKDAGISATNIRIAVGDENPKQLIGHFLNAARLVIDRDQPGFTDLFPGSEEVDVMVRDTYLDAHARYIQATDSLSSFLS